MHVRYSEQAGILLNSLLQLISAFCAAPGNSHWIINYQALYNALKRFGTSVQRYIINRIHEETCEELHSLFYTSFLLLYFSLLPLISM